MNLIMFSLVICVFVPQLTKGANKADYYKLHKDLFGDPDRYTKDVRPAINETHPVLVHVFFDLSALVDVDEKEQTLVTSGTLRLNWGDSSLSWEYPKYGDITSFLVPQSSVYLPDVRVFNSVRATKQLGYPEQQVRLYDSGAIIWEPNVLLVTSCDIDITYFPFDTQICYITLTTAASERDEVQLKTIETNDALFLSNFSPNGQWELVQTNAKEMESEKTSKSMIRFGLLLKRRKVFYMLNIILPVFFLSLTASLVFALPADEGEKMGTGITVLLAFAVYLTIVSELVPNTSLQVSVLALYLTTLLGMCAISVVVCAFILRLHFRDEDIPVGPKTTRFTHFLQRLTCSGTDGDASCTNKVVPLGGQNMKTCKESSDTRLQQPINNENSSNVSRPTPSTKKNQDVLVVAVDNLTWKQVAKTLDRVFFIVFTVLSIGITSTCMLMLGVGGVVNAPDL